MTAPFAGTVASVPYTPGQIVSANASSGTGITVVSTSSWGVVGSVIAASISQVHDEETVPVAPQGDSSMISGSVANVALVAQNTGGVATFPVTISIQGDPSGLLDGLPANVSITTSSAVDVIELPVLAVRNLSVSPYVLEVTSNGKGKNVVIRVGRVVGADVVVLSGLTPGEKVLERVPRFGGLIRGPRKRGAFGGGGFVG
nr:HlyD family efflux transporter periplasmic adaptor subunit [Ferrithrix thermotolerans]